MESDMVNNLNLNPQDCVSLVINYFRNNFPAFKLIKEGSYTGYWWVEYANEDEKVLVNIDGDIGGGFSVKIFIDNTEYNLWQFDKSVNNATESNSKNIIYQLNVLKNFLLKRPS
jgi:hypothetical protein